MDKIISFAQENYLIFIIVSVILIFSLIGYVADKSISKDVEIKSDDDEK